MKPFLRGRGRTVTFLSILFLCVALAMLAARWRTSSDELETLREIVDVQQQTIGDQRQLIIATRQGLAEVCRSNAITRGLVLDDIEIKRKLAQEPGLSEATRRRLRLGVNVYEGYVDQLDQQTACREVLNP